MNIKHEGFNAWRLSKAADNPREAAFAEQWAHVNETRTGTPHGILQYLLGNGTGSTTYQGVAGLTQDQATVAATVVQWLGSNVGMSFLDVALDKCGYKIVRNGR